MLWAELGDGDADARRREGWKHQQEPGDASKPAVLPWAWIVRGAPGGLRLLNETRKHQQLVPPDPSTIWSCKQAGYKCRAYVELAPAHRCSTTLVPVGPWAALCFAACCSRSSVNQSANWAPRLSLPKPNCSIRDTAALPLPSPTGLIVFSLLSHAHALLDTVPPPSPPCFMPVSGMWYKVREVVSC